MLSVTDWLMCFRANSHILKVDLVRVMFRTYAVTGCFMIVFSCILNVFFLGSEYDFYVSFRGTTYQNGFLELF